MRRHVALLWLLASLSGCDVWSTGVIFGDCHTPL